MKPSNRPGMFSRKYLTKLDIAKSLNELCKEKELSKIRIDEVASQSRLSRSGFYYHFTSLNDVVTWLSMQFYEQGIDQTGRTLTWLEGHLVTTRGFYKFKPLFTAGALSTDYDGGRPFFTRHRQENLTETLVNYQHLELTKKLSFQIEAIPYIERNMTHNWEMGRYDLTLFEFCELLTSLVPRELYEALNTPVEKAALPIEIIQAML